MTPLRSAIVMLATLVLVAHSALAAASFSASDLAFTGRAETTADGSALFLVVSDPGGTTWSLTATRAVLERTYIECRIVTAPVTNAKMDERCGDLVAEDPLEGSPPTVETRTFDDVTITSGAITKEAALLLRSDGATVASRTGALHAASVKDPRFDQGPPPTASTTSESISLSIHEDLRGQFVNLSAAGGVFEVQGDASLMIYGMGYHLASPEGAYDARTGHVERSRTGPYAEYVVERDVLTLTGVKLTLTTASPVVVAARHASVTLDGTLRAGASDGALALDTLALKAPGSWDGTATLDLAPAADGRLSAAPSASVTTSSAILVPRTPALVAWMAGVVAGVALVALAVWAIRRRATRSPADDLDLALLAMEERRWNDALPHLERLAAKRPDDAVVLVDRALCLEESGRLDAARAGYERALQVAPFSAEAHYYYARTLARLRMTTSAMAHLTRALTLDERLAELARSERAFASFADHPSFVGLVR